LGSGRICKQKGGGEGIVWVTSFNGKKILKWGVKGCGSLEKMPAWKWNRFFKRKKEKRIGPLGEFSN